MWLDRHFERIADDDPECGPFKALYKSGENKRSRIVNTSLPRIVREVCGISDTVARDILDGKWPSHMPWSKIHKAISWLLASGQAHGGALMAHHLARASGTVIEKDELLSSAFATRSGADINRNSLDGRPIRETGTVSSEEPCELNMSKLRVIVGICRVQSK